VYHRIRCKILNYKISNNLGENQDYLGLDSDFLDAIPKAWPTKERIR
jgi:hypothetical protein